MTSQSERKKRVNILLGVLISSNLVMDEDKLIARFSHHYGVARRTVREYLGELEAQELIIREKGEVWARHPKELTKKEEEILRGETEEIEEKNEGE